YNLNLSTAGTYGLNLRLSSPGSTGKLLIRKSDGSVVATVTVPNTGDWQNFQTVNTLLSLPSGSQTLRIQSVSDCSWNFNWMELAIAPTAASQRIEAENFSNMNGVRNET